MKYVLTGGGTGGHVYPALAIAEELGSLDPDAEFLFVGVKGRAEAKLVPEAGYLFRTVPAIGFPRGRSPVTLGWFLLMLLLGVLKASWILLKWRPHAVIGTGGYASAPIMIATVILAKTKLLTVPALIHEQNAVPGKLNRLIARWASAVASTYGSAIPFLPPERTLLSGYPVRKRIACSPTKEEARTKLSIPPTAKVLLVFGGSLGARSINNGIVAALPFLKDIENLLIIHGTGRAPFSGYDPVTETNARLETLPFSPGESFYRKTDYLDPMADYMASADLVVCRAGAGTLSELCAVGLAALIVPKANLPGDHQVRNALALRRAGAVEVLYERPVRGEHGIVEIVSPGELAEKIKRLFQDPERRACLSENARRLSTPEASRILAKTVLALISGDVIRHPPVEQGRQPELSKELDLLTTMGGGELLQEVHRRISADPGLTVDQHRYLAYRADGYLASSSWEERNRGVKLAGLLGLADRGLLLASLVYEKRRIINVWHRLTRSSYRENDFIRRNSLVALSRIGVWNHHVRRAIVTGLGDPYFEIRTAAAAAAGTFPQEAPRDREIMDLLAKLLKDPRFEVREAALRAIGEVGDGGTWARVITPFFTEHNWKVRAAALDALRRMAERGQLTVGDMPHLMEQLRGLLLTSTGFTPTFEIKSALLALKESLEEL